MHFHSPQVGVKSLSSSRDEQWFTSRYTLGTGRFTVLHYIQNLQIVQGGADDQHIHIFMLLPGYKDKCISSQKHWQEWAIDHSSYKTHRAYFRKISGVLNEHFAQLLRIRKYKNYSKIDSQPVGGVWQLIMYRNLQGKILNLFRSLNTEP